MKTSYAGMVNPGNIPQTEPLNERQVVNHAGGYVYAIDDFKRLERFLILGSDGATYYQSARKLTRENAKVVETCWSADAQRTAEIIATISEAGRAPKNDPAIFALALGAMNPDVKARQAALSVVERVCRTGTHILQFVSLSKELGRGFGRAMKRAVGGWYLNKDVGKLAYQVVKYRNRAGLTHENVLDMARPKTDDADRKAVFSWIVGNLPLRGEVARPDNFPSIIVDHERAMETENSGQLLPIVLGNKGLPWEALPTWANADPKIQAELLPYMGMTALVRNLGNLTRIGVITPLSTAEAVVCDRLSNKEEIKRSRIHPLQILFALKVYGSGRGVAHGNKTPHTWSPNRRIMAVLNEAFYAAFGNVEPSGKRHFIGVDVSGSMGSNFVGDGRVLSCFEAAAALALVTARTEPATFIARFNNVMEPVNFSNDERLETAMQKTGAFNGGGTDCALPMMYAKQHGIQADVFVVLTDNETWAGRIHPMEALREYRKTTGIPAKLIVVGMTSTGFSIADPQDAGTLDVVGFDAGTPAIMADFARN